MLCRSDSLPDGIDEKYDLEMLTRLKRQIETDPPEDPTNRYSSEANKVMTTTESPTTTAAANVSNQTQENTYLHLTIYDTKITLTNLGHFQEYSIEVGTFKRY